MKPYQRFLQYAAIQTASDSTQKRCPSTNSQFTLANLLVEEMHGLGINNARVTEHCFVYASLPATPGYEEKPKLGFLAHLDTVSDFCEHQINPVIHPNYQGQDLPLGNSYRTLKVEEYPHLSLYKGQDLITSDGTTNLGADDKAGIAEIITMAECILTSGIPHGTICIAFTPDEEMYNEVHYFDFEEFGADYAFTLDGEGEGEIQYETFYACQADFTIHGYSTHPGSAKNTMVNASLIAIEINNMLPQNETPRDTELYEGYYHLTNISGDSEHSELHYSIRDHNQKHFEERKTILRQITNALNKKWGPNTISLTLTDTHKNMAEVIQHHMHLIQNSSQACINAGIEPKVIPLRGVTDGCWLSFHGLPCPNIGTGGHAFHTPFEHITIESMEKVTQMLVELIKLYSR